MPSSSAPASSSATARAGNRRFGLSNARCAHRKAPYNIDLLWETLRARNRSGQAPTKVGDCPAGVGIGVELEHVGHHRDSARAGNRRFWMLTALTPT